MQVRIYKPAKSPTQSGKGKNSWMLEFRSLFGTGRYVEDILARIASTDMLKTEICLLFATKEEAIKFAKDNYYQYEVIEPKLKSILKKSYANNFI